MKPMIVSVCTLFTMLCALSLQAQPQMRGTGQRPQFDPETRAAMQTERMNKEVGLSKEQSEKVKALFLERYKERQAARAQQPRGTRVEPRPAAPGTQRPVMQADTAFTRRLNEILTPEQSAKWAEAQKKTQEQMMNNRGGRRPVGGTRGR